MDYMLVAQEEEPANHSLENIVFLLEETKTSDAESRNTRIGQCASKFTYANYYCPDPPKYMLYNEEATSDKDRTPTDTNIFGTNMLLAQEVRFIGKTMTPFCVFATIDELIAFKKQMRLPNKTNVPILLNKIDNKTITVSGRLSKPKGKGNIGHDPSIGTLFVVYLIYMVFCGIIRLFLQGGGQMKVELDSLFLDKLKTGISIFSGAGFSVLPAPDGAKLPNSAELCVEIQKEFGLQDIPVERGLEYISEFCPESEYQTFLRNRFTVSEYNPLYDVINKLTIKNFVTTNIDNIIRKLTDHSERYYLKSIREYGATMNGCNELCYIPLHGDVSDPNSKLYFGSFDLAVVDKQNRDLFDLMYGKLAKEPILFIGYGFHDKAVLSVIKRLMDLGTTDIWVQFLPEDKDNIELFKSKGCHIIEASTESLLSWIDTNIQDDSGNLASQNAINKDLHHFCVPTISEVVSIPQKEFFQQGNTGWHSILTDVPYERKIVAELENATLTRKNVILIGCRFSGKTTILMQLARKVKHRNKFYVDGITKEEAEFMIKKIGEQDVWIFFNNCTDNILAYNAFAKIKNIKLVGASEEYRFETVKHLLDKAINYKVFNCNEISKDEARQIFNKIPSGIRKEHFSYKETSDEKFSMLEMVAQNVIGVFTKKHISKMLHEIEKHNIDMLKIVALTSYLSENGSAISYVNVANLLDINVYPNAVNIVKQTKDYLRAYDYRFDLDEEEQDYFILRSKLFAINVRNILIEEYKKFFASIVSKFTVKEAQYNILRYNVFRRKAYDAEFFAKLFTLGQAETLYKELYEKDDSPYTLQQWALCLASFKHYQDAFIKIDKAISLMPNNFSFKNSQAIILFESNKEIGSADAIGYMEKAMDTLKMCYMDDKRKIYHAQKFAEFAIYFHNKYDRNDYLENAWQWISEIIQEDSSPSPRTLRIRDKLMSIKSKL